MRITSMIRIELTRFRARRGVNLLLLGAVLMAAVTAGLTIWESRPPTDLERSTARAQAALGGDAEASTQLTVCRRDPVAYLGPGGTEEQCDAAFDVDAAQYLPRAPLDLAGTLRGNGLGLTLLLAALLLCIAGYVAHQDQSDRGIAQQSLVVRSRFKLWSAKVAAAALVGALTSAVALGVFWAAVFVAAVERERPHGSELVRDLLGQAGRGVALAAGVAAGMVALTLLFRHARTAFGLVFAASIGLEALLLLAPAEQTGRWTPVNNLLGWISIRGEYVGGDTWCDRTGSCLTGQLSALEAGSFLGALLAVALVLSALAFARRDL